jgi:hypothetical protein
LTGIRDRVSDRGSKLVESGIPISALGGLFTRERGKAP